ncbi:MAG: hypothetical protein HY858_15885 [Candidatus Solibacter usitatus]|nr:hypothetical protein [Candidatus Solibacter usitatus]
MAKNHQAPELDLQSWKEIAAYLCVHMRTAQTWERTHDMPVRHFPGAKGRVAASSAELEAWRRAQFALPSGRHGSRRRFVAIAAAVPLVGVAAWLTRRAIVRQAPAGRQPDALPLLALAPTPRTILLAQAVDGGIYAGQGQGGPAGIHNDRFDRYDPWTNTWTPLPMPTDAYGRASAACADRIYAFGGVEHAGPLARVDFYDTLRNTWSRCSGMPTPRTHAAAAVVRESVYVMGGSHVFGASFGTQANECYQPGTDSWSIRRPMPRKRIGHCIAAVDGKIYVFGGASQAIGSHEVDLYDPVTDRWTTLDRPWANARTAAAVAVVGGRIYLIGGHDPTGTCGAVDEFDPSTEIWAERAQMPAPRSFPAAAVLGGIIYVIGGENISGKLSTMETFDPGMARGPWSARLRTPLRPALASFLPSSPRLAP